MRSRPVTVDPDREAVIRALGALPAPVARGMHVCSPCQQPLRKDEPLVYLAVASASDPFTLTRVEAENIGFHADCHARWHADRLARARTLAAQSPSSTPKEPA